MTGAENLREFGNSLIGHFLSYGRTVDRREICLGCNTFHYRGVRSDDHVVLIHAPTVITFRFQHTTDTEWYALETDCLADRISTIREEFVCDSLTDKADLGTLVNILFSKRNTLLNIPLLDVEIVERLAIDGGVGIVGAIYCLTA